ncbi:MAG: ABC transporter permease [Bacillota bacterium]
MPFIESFHHSLKLDGIYNDLRISGMLLGIAMGWYGKISTVLDPFVSALYATPRIALLPLLVIWFRIGMGSKIAFIFIFLGLIFPILVNTVTGCERSMPI